MVSLALSSPNYCSTPSRLPSRSVKPSKISIHRCYAISNKKPDDPNIETSQSGKVDRRNLLLGVGGLYGAAAAQTAFATPIASPDLSKCSTGTNLNTQQPLDIGCCLPISPDIIDFKLPPVTKSKMRVRPAAHLAGPDYYAKYEKALSLMKALPTDDPRSFTQQANVHCAYCNLVYDQQPAAGKSNLKLQIHNCWHFYPWHRWYLYFYERILGKLIDDPTFALPFWNWDHPDAMIMPSQFARKDSPLFDARRNQDHLPPARADLAYSAKSPTKPAKIVSNNLSVMYTEMVRNGSKLEDFYGAKYIVGTSPDPGPGTVERGSHAALHSWVGENTASGEDMGNFYSAGREPLFYSHHANIDRLWSIWRGLRGPKKPKDFPDKDWLQADYVFYDEDARLVRVTNADTLENERMGYVYQDVDIPWLKNRPKPRTTKSKVAAAATSAAGVVFPVRLDKVVKVLVDRPRKTRSKDEEEELLVIEGIEVDTAAFVKFDVFVNDEDDKADELDKAEYAGCYSQVPHKNSIFKIQVDFTREERRRRNMSWLARSIANSLRLDDEEEDGPNEEEKNLDDAVPRPTPYDAVSPEDRPRATTSSAEDLRSSDSDGVAACNNCGDEDLDGDDNRRGVKEDLSELKDSLTRQLWGVASFLAPPPPPPPPPPPLIHRSGSVHSELKSCGTGSGNDEDGDEWVEHDERESGEFAFFSPSENYYTNVIEGAIGITEEVLAFARNIAHHPETWLDFPLSEEEEFDDFDISDSQYKHALAVEHLSPRLAALRIELCPVHMSEGYFWMVYFVLVHSRLNKHDADLLSSPQIVQARILWMQELQKRTKEESSWLGLSTFHSKESADPPHQNFITHSYEDSHFGNLSEPISPVESSMHQMKARHDIEKHSVNEIEFIDKSVIKEDLATELQEKEMIVSCSFEIPVQDEYDDDDDWLKEDSDLIAYSGTSIVGNEENISFSDLEDDLDSTMPTKYKIDSAERNTINKSS